MTTTLLPMDTAPRDGTVILVLRFDYWIAVRWADEDRDFPWEGVHLGGALCFMQNGWQANDMHFVGWTPLPEPLAKV